MQTAIEGWRDEHLLARSKGNNIDRDQTSNKTQQATNGLSEITYKADYIKARVYKFNSLLCYICYYGIHSYTLSALEHNA